MKLPALPTLPLRRDPKAALARSRHELTQAEHRLVELAQQRQAALVDSGDIGAVATIDASLDEVHKTIRILNDRVAAQANLVWLQDNEQRERERGQAIEKLQLGFAKRYKLALELEAAVKVLGEAWSALLGSRETALAAWPEMFPRPPAEVLRSRQMERELSWQMFSCAGAEWGQSRLPSPNNVGLGVTGISPKGIAGVVAEEHANILESLRSQPLPEPSTIEEEAA
jgi:hypothetical protein